MRKTFNDQLTIEDHSNAYKACEAIIKKLERAMKYGEDMRGSRFSCMYDAHFILSEFLNETNIA